MSSTPGIHPVLPEVKLAGKGLEHLFSAVLQFTSDAPDAAVIPRDGRDGDYIGSGEGSVRGAAVNGSLRWSLYAADCLYPRIRQGERVLPDLHLCAMNPGGFIETHDGARSRFDGRGYGLRSPEWYHVAITLAFRAEDPRYAWLDSTIGLTRGEFDERTGRASWEVYVARRQDAPHPGLSGP
jgi:hypothetical protein